MTVVYLCLGVTQMLNNNKINLVPRNDASYSVGMKGRNPKDTWWVYEGKCILYSYPYCNMRV